MKKISLAMCVAAASTAIVACAAEPAAAPAAAQPAAQPAAAPAGTMQVYTSPDGYRRIVTTGPTCIMYSADKGLNTVIQQAKLPAAIAANDAAGTLAAAQKLQEYEAKRKAIDNIFNSENAYKLAATYATAQGNTVLAQQIVTAAPATQPIVQQMTITRGAKKNAPAAIPQMVEVKFGGWEKLTAAQQPVWGDYIMAFYPTLDRAAAAALAAKVNDGRHFLPVQLAQAAIDLSKLKGKDVPAAFQAKNVFRNAADMAIFLADKAAMEKIIALYNKANFKDAKTAKNLAAELKAMEKTRGARIIRWHGPTMISTSSRGLMGQAAGGAESEEFDGPSERAFWTLRAMNGWNR